MLFLVTGGVFQGSEVHLAPGAMQDVEGGLRELSARIGFCSLPELGITAW